MIPGLAEHGASAHRWMQAWNAGAIHFAWECTLAVQARKKKRARRMARRALECHRRYVLASLRCPTCNPTGARTLH